MRVFAAIPLPSEVRDHLARTLALVAPVHRVARNPWLPVDNWHVTLAFYGDQPDDLVTELMTHLTTAAVGITPFRLALAGAGTFRHDVCWIGLSDPTETLPRFAEAARGPYDLPNQHAHNRFHVTISRQGRQRNLADAMAALSIYRGPEWTVDRVVLMSSDLGKGLGGHPLYASLGEIRLDGIPETAA